MKITQIKPQKNNKRVNIYLDYKFGFGLDLENFVKLNLKVDQDITEEEVRLIKGKADKAKVFDKVLRFSMLRPRSEKEVKEYFKRKKINDSIYQSIIQKLKKFELLDDEKFAKWWVEQRQSFRPRSKRVLIQELRIKGINSEIIENTLDNNVIDEEKIAKELLEKKKYKWEKYDETKRRQKMMQYLAGKGYSWNIVTKVVK